MPFYGVVDAFFQLVSARVSTSPLVAYLRTEEDARDDIVGKADILVALMPEAATVLEREGKPHFIPSDFRDAYLFARYGIDAHERRTQFISAMDEELERQIPEFRDAGFQPLRTFAYTFACFHESILWAVHLLEESFNKLRPGSVWISPTPPCENVLWPFLPLPRIPALTRFVGNILHGPGKPPMPRSDLHFRESLYSLLLPALCEAAGVPLVQGRTVVPVPSAALPVRLEACDIGDPSRFQKDAWLILSPAYEMAPLRQHLLSRNLPTIFGPDLAVEKPGYYAPYCLRARLRCAFINLMSDERYLELFGPAGIAVKNVVAARLEYIFLALIPAYWENYQTAMDILRRVKPKVVIGGFTGYLWEMAFLPAARALGIPTVQYKHGWSQYSYPCTCNQLPTADLYLTWEDPERACCGSDDVRSHGVAVGSSRLESLARRHRPEEVARIKQEWNHADRPLCLYVPNWVEHTRRSVSCLEEPVWQYRFQRRLFEIFVAHPEVDFIWKPLLPWGFDPRLFRSPVPDHIRMVTTTSASELMWAADLILLDAISSPLVEAALTQAPIVVLSRHPALEGNEGDLEMLRRRAEIYDDPDRYFARVEELLTGGNYHPIPNPDDSFLRDKNVNPLGVGAPERAIQAIEHLLESRT